MRNGISNALYTEFENMKQLYEDMLFSNASEYATKVVDEAMQKLFSAYHFQVVEESKCIKKEG